MSSNFRFAFVASLFLATALAASGCGKKGSPEKAVAALLGPGSAIKSQVAFQIHEMKAKAEGQALLKAFQVQAKRGSLPDDNICDHIEFPPCVSEITSDGRGVSCDNSCPEDAYSLTSCTVFGVADISC